MSALVPLPFAIPLFGAALAIIVGKWRWVQRIISVAVLSSAVVISVILLIGADDEGYVVHRSGGWPAPLGISLVVDRLAGIMMVISSIVLLSVLVFAISQRGEEQRRVSFHPVYLVLAAGVFMSFATADLFDLFVAFEMMLCASYVLITLGGRPDQVKAGTTYVVISLVASTLLITVIALMYASTGTVNMADLAERLDHLDPRLRAVFAIALLVVFGIKAGIFPLFFWLPDSYPTAPGPVTAIFAGLLTKVGVYAIIRTQTLLFDMPDWMGTLLIITAVLTMVIGVFGAVVQDDMKRILAFHIISQIGYMILGLGLFTLAGIAGAVFYTANQILLKTALFLVTGLVARRAGSSRLSEVGGLVREAPFIAILFAIPALSLAGLPPFSGFIAKFAVIEASVASAEWYAVAFALGVSLLTMYSMLKIWGGVFWGVRDETPRAAPIKVGIFGSPMGMLTATAALAAVIIGISIAAGPLYALAERAASDLMAPGGYIEAVLGARG